MRRYRVLGSVVGAWALLGAAAWAATPPAPSRGSLEFRVLLNQETKPLALAAIASPDTRARVAEIADYVLGQVGEINLWRYLVESEDSLEPAALLAPYGMWAEERGLRQVGFYRLRRGADAKGHDQPDALAYLYYRAGADGALLAVMADPAAVTLAWAEGDIGLGPLAAAWLGLPGASVPTEAPAAVEARLPELPADLPEDLLDIRLDLSAAELQPLANDISARMEADPTAVASDLATILRKGVRVLKPVRGLTVLVYATPDADSVERVAGPAKQYALAKGWGGLFQYGEGDQAAELYAKMGDGGGAMVVGRRGAQTALLFIEGCPDLMALLAP